MADTALMFALFSLALFSFPAFAQEKSEGPGCGGPSDSFSVQTDHVSNSPVQSEPGKALVYVIEDDSNFASFPKPTTRTGIDGKWIGATHGNSYLYFTVDPGVHHLCTSWQKAVILGRGRQTSALHFTAEEHGIYFFQVKNVFQHTEYSALFDSTLQPIDSDEGQVLVRKYQLSTSRSKH